jgi:hypothetical protein
MYSRFFVAASTILAAIIILAMALIRWNGADMSRPLQCDEQITLEYYTWAGLTPEGEPHQLRRAEDFHALPPVEPRQLGMGIYRSLGVWTEPNNHVVHSLLVNFAVASGKPDERTVRIPALLGAIAASLFAFWVCRRHFGWRAAAPFAAVVVFSLPYMVQYSQEARGYSWMIAFIFLQLGLMYRLARQPDSIVWGAACAITAILTFMNVVSLALDWLFPLYLAFLIVPPTTPGTEPLSSEKKRLWRRNLSIQLLAIGGVGLVFLIDRLPAVYSSMNQYGISFTGLTGFLHLLSLTLRYLFPGHVWELVAVLGLAGILIMLFVPSDRPLGVAVLFTLAVSLGHFWITRRFPYERACGYLVPFAVMGNCYLVEIALARIQSTGWRRGLYGGLSAATVALAVLSLKWPVAFDERMVVIPELISEEEGLERAPSYAILPPGGDSLRSILPNTWIDPGDSLPDQGKVNLVCCLTDREGPCLLMEEGASERRMWRHLDHLPSHQTRSAHDCRLLWQRMSVTPLRPDTEVVSCLPCLIIWRPAPERLGLDGHTVREHVARFEIP